MRQSWPHSPSWTLHDALLAKPGPLDRQDQDCHLQMPLVRHSSSHPGARWALAHGRSGDLIPGPSLGAAGGMPQVSCLEPEWVA